MDPVVSKFGKRPLLEMPAMHVDSSSRVEVSSLRPRLQPLLDTSPALIYRPEGLNPQSTLPIVPGVGTVNPGVAMAIPAPALPAATATLPQANGVPGSLYSLPPSNMPLQPYPYPTQMNGLTLQPQPLYFVDSSGNIINPASAAPPVYPQYPAVQNPYPGYYQPGMGAPPGMMPPQVQYVPVPAPKTPSIVEENFQIEGVLEYGRLTTVHFRDKTSNFRGLPDFLRRELQKAYGHFPVTDVRVVCQGGEFHIHASPRSDGEDYNADGASDSRMIGWGEVRGEPR